MGLIRRVVGSLLVLLLLPCAVGVTQAFVVYEATKLEHFREYVKAVVSDQVWARTGGSVTGEDLAMLASELFGIAIEPLTRGALRGEDLHRAIDACSSAIAKRAHDEYHIAGYNAYANAAMGVLTVMSLFLAVLAVAACKTAKWKLRALAIPLLFAGTVALLIGTVGPLLLYSEVGRPMAYVDLPCNRLWHTAHVSVAPGL